MPTKTVVHTDKAPPPLPVYSQAIICQGMVYATSPCCFQIAITELTSRLIWNEMLTLHFHIDTAPDRSPWTQRPKQLQKVVFQIELQVTPSTSPPPSK